MQPADVARIVMQCVNSRPGDISWLFGPANVQLRQRIMQAATGQRLSKAKCGINAVMKELYRIFPVPSYSCIADAERQLGALIERSANA